MSNVTGREPKLAFTFFCQLTIPACFLFLILRKFRLKFTVQKQLKSPEVNFKTDADLAHYTLIVSNIPANYSVAEMEAKIQTTLTDIFGPSIFIQARVIGYYEQAYRNCVQLKEEIQDLRYYKELNFQNYPERAKLKVMREELDAEFYFEARIDKLRRKVNAEIKENEHTNMGKAFLMFSEPKVVKCLCGLGQDYFR